MSRRLPKSLKKLVPPDLILSIHIPKTGGITLQSILEEKFGDSLVLDYPYTDEIKKRKKPIKAIHGHFEIKEYLDFMPDPLSAPRIIIFLREPLDRALSHFYYWLNDPPPQDDPVYKKYFQEREPRLEDFLLAREMRNICTCFLHPLDHPEYFWFVGFQETFDRDAARLQKMLGMPIHTPPVLNKGRPRPEIEISDEVKNRFYELNWRDKAFYDLMFNRQQKLSQSE
jgi:hypothetical protein